MSNLDDFKEHMRVKLFGATLPNCCVSCKEPFSDKNVRTPAGWRETQISKMCENCWDKTFATDGEGSDE